MPRDRNFYMSLDEMDRLDIRLPSNVIKDIETIVKHEFDEFEKEVYGSLNHFILVAVLKQIRKHNKKTKHLNSRLIKKHTRAKTLQR